MQRVDLATGTDDHEVQVPETIERVEPSNMESAKKLIAKYQQRIRELMKSIHQQKKANDQLKEELKKLNDTLNSLVTKITVKSKVEKDDSQITKRQLQNEMKKTASLRKQIQGLKARMKAYDSQKMSDMQDEIKQKDKIIESMHQNIKLHQKFQKKDMNLDIYKKEEEAQLTIKALSEEIVHLKKKTQDQKKFQEQQDKSMKFQQLQLIALEDKKNSPSKLNLSNIQTPPITVQQQHQKLQQLFKSSENSRKSLEKSSKIEGELLRTKLRQAEKTIEELKQQLGRKQKEIALMNLRLKMVGNTESVQSKQEDFGAWTSPGQDCRRELKGLMNIRSASRRFDDSTGLPFDNEFRMSKLIFNYFEEHIVQMKVQYQILGSERSDNRMQMVSSFAIGSHYNSMKEAVLTLSDYEYIKQWEIYCGKCIQFMKIRTSKQQVLEVGNQRNSLKCKKYTFDIKSYEKPIAVFGVLEVKNIADKEIEVLINLGLILKRKNIFGKRAKSLAKLQSKTPSLLFNRPNDKNLLQ